jgi:hypothetical protein
MKKQFKSKDFNGAAFVVFSSEEPAREFVEKSKQTAIKYDDGSVLECSLQDDHYKKKALDSATGGKSSDDDLSGAVIHLAGMKEFDFFFLIIVFRCF